MPPNSRYLRYLGKTAWHPGWSFFRYSIATEKFLILEKKIDFHQNWEVTVVSHFSVEVGIWDFGWKIIGAQCTLTRQVLGWFYNQVWAAEWLMSHFGRRILRMNRSVFVFNCVEQQSALLPRCSNFPNRFFSLLCFSDFSVSRFWLCIVVSNDSCRRIYAVNVTQECQHQILLLHIL